MKITKLKIFLAAALLFFSIGSFALAQNENGEALIILKSGTNPSDILKYSGKKKNVKDQAYSMKRYTEPIAKNVKGIKIADKNAINNFIVYGTKSTLKLSALQRYELIKLYKTKYKKLPVKQADWENLLKLNAADLSSSGTAGTYFQNPDSLKTLPKGACPDGWDGKNFTLNNAKLGIDIAQVDWINANCEKFKKDNDVSTEPISGSIPDGIIQNDRIEDALESSPNNPDIIYVGTEGNGIFKSIDGGKNWKWLRSGLKHGKSCGGAYPETYGIAINPQNDSIIYAAMTCGPESANNPVGGVYKSIDGGETWTQKIKGLPSAAVDSIALDKNNPNIIYIGTNGEKSTSKNEILPGGIYKSADAGETWTALYEKSNRFDKIIIKNNIILASGLKWSDAGNTRVPDVNNSAGLIKSLDGGKNWVVIKKDFISAFDLSEDDKTIYAAAQNGTGYKSDDSGETWTKITINSPIAMNPFDSKTFLYGSIKKSVNGNSRDVLKPAEWISRIEYTSNPNIIYAGSPGYIIYKSTDGGETFSEIANLRKFINGN